MCTPLVLAYVVGTPYSSLPSAKPLTSALLQVTGDRKFKDITIPDGDTIMLSPSLAGRREEVRMSVVDIVRWCTAMLAVAANGVFVFTFLLVLASEAGKDLDSALNRPLLFCSVLFSLLRQVWTNPDEFDPYRWLLPREENRKFSHGWVGFGGGRHRCIGENFAYVQIKAIWAYLLRNFDMEAVGPLPKVRIQRP